MILHVLLILTISTVLLSLTSSSKATPVLSQHPILPSDLYDNFEGPSYTITDNQISPNGKWFNKYNGFGVSGTVATTSLTATEDNNTVFYEEPKTSTRPNETHAALTLTTQTYEDLEMHLKVKTNKQLRQNSIPNPWEVAWIMWRYQDEWHHYYFIFKPNGIELGKKQNENQAEEQIFLYTANEPKLRIDEWNTWYIKMSGNHIEIWLDMADGSMQRVVNYHDNAPIVGPGNIGLYTEDAHVQFDDVYIASLNS
ncbi:MAG TPA: family 16 glycoside hydrolase [Nitrososphaeraceae archaeon]|nr:family 16 glycoside hydrolase [Nitrososphaeraceae archaeon]